MIDIYLRLRELQRLTEKEEPFSHLKGIWKDAADEIKMLRAERDHWSALVSGADHALVELYKLCRTLGNFKNGVEHNGIDEGEVYASGVFDRVEGVLRGNHKWIEDAEHERHEQEIRALAASNGKDFY